ncbi:MAG: hypothetical protein Q4F95_00865 [Oscillospiraceae bacterium]|nr:hypothetical protein [Oscillospiraceae bacterium]
MSLVRREQKVAFYGVPTTSGSSTTTTYTRMQKFTSLSTSKGAKEYSRQYVDEAFETSSVVGYSPSIGYEFDLHTGNTVHQDIVSISDEEKLGDDAVREIIVVDKTTAGSSSGSFKASKRSFTVVPSSEGDSTDAYTYSGDFKCAGEIVKGEATSSDGWQTVTFTADSD